MRLCATTGQLLRVCALFGRGAALLMTLIACMALAACTALADDPSDELPTDRPLRLLFIGNSMTYYNDLPAMFQRFATAAGKQVYVDSSTASNYTLDAHANPQDNVGHKTYAKIRQGRWDYVVMQDLTDRSTYPDQRPRMVMGARRLKEEIDNIHARTLLYMTWAYAYGDRTYPRYPQASTFAGMQEMIRAGYHEVGDALGIPVVPMGEAWPEALRRWPGSKGSLYQNDNNHPRMAGTLMNVAVLYHYLFREDPSQVPDHEGLSEDLANFVLSVAASIDTNQP